MSKSLGLKKIENFLDNTLLRVTQYVHLQKIKTNTQMKFENESNIFSIFLSRSFVLFVYGATK